MATGVNGPTVDEISREGVRTPVDGADAAQ